MSSTIPSWSTARQSQCRRPWILSCTSSICHLSPGRGRPAGGASARDRVRRRGRDAGVPPTAPALPSDFTRDDLGLLLALALAAAVAYLPVPAGARRRQGPPRRGP